MKKIILFIITVIASQSLKAQWNRISEINTVSASNQRYFNDKFDNLYILSSRNLFKYQNGQFSQIGDLEDIEAIPDDDYIISVRPSKKFGFFIDNLQNIYLSVNTGNTYNVAKWNGQVWQLIGSLNANGRITSISVDTNGNIFCAGQFKDVNDRAYVAKFNGTQWQTLGNSSLNLIDGEIYDIVHDQQNNLYAAGFSSTLNSNNVAKWNNQFWSNFNQGYDLGKTERLLIHNSNLYLYSINNLYSTKKVFQNNGSAWTEIGNFPFLNQVNLEISASGILYANDNNVIKNYANGAWSTVMSNVPENYNTPTSTGLISKNFSNNDFCVWQNNIIGIEQIFTLTNNEYSNISTLVAKSSSTNQTILGPPNIKNLPPNDNFGKITNVNFVSQNEIYALSTSTYSLPNGTNLIQTYVVKWNGIQWQKVSKSFIRDGDLIATLGPQGYYVTSSSNTNAHILKKWNFALNTWETITSLNGSVRSMIINNNGDLFLAGEFKNTSNFAYVGKYSNGNFSEIGQAIGSLSARKIIDIKFYQGDVIALFETGIEASVGRWHPNENYWEIIANISTSPFFQAQYMCGTVPARFQGQMDVVNDNEIYIYNFCYASVIHYNGTTWNQLPNFPSNISEIKYFDNTFYASTLDSVGGILRESFGYLDNNFIFQKQQVPFNVELGFYYDNSISDRNFSSSQNIFIITALDEMCTPAIFYRNSTSLNVPTNSFDDFSNLLYPNPTTQIINIQFKENGLFKIFDIYGKSIMETYNKQVDVSNYTPGVYIVKSPNGLVKKFIKM